jgi:hypothetical protein
MAKYQPVTGEICKVQTEVTIGSIIGSKLADIPLPVLNICTALQQLHQDFPQQ